MASIEALSSLSPRKRPLADVHDSDSPGLPAEASPVATSLLTPPISYSNHSTPTPSKSTGAVERAASPASSSLTSLSGGQLEGDLAANGVPGAPPQKRRKLTPSEKLQKHQEKEAKAKERAEAKAKREEEKRVEDEEKQRKRAEREEKKRQKEFEDQQKKQQKDLEKQQKDLAKQQEEEEKQKKERSQLRLNAFFTKPKASPTVTPASPTKYRSAEQETSPSKSRHSALTTPDIASSAVPSPGKSVLTDYEKRFLPFFLPANAVMAPNNHFRDLPEASDLTSDRVEQVLQSTLSTSQIQAELAEAIQADSDNSVPVKTSVQEIISRLHGTPDKPIDLTKHDAADTDMSPLQLLKAIPMKYIHFEQDVRPAYYGTYTRPLPPLPSKHLARSAWSCVLPNTDYDYDSEAEWEEPEEGEDILSEGEEDGESLDGDDDMEAFLDDENDSPKRKRPIIMAELEPDCSGLCWEDDQRQMRKEDSSNECPTFHGFRMGILLEKAPATIDPFSTVYWEKDVKTKSTPATSGATTTSNNDSSTMQPPVRVPLQPRPNGGNSKIMEDFAGKPAATQITPATVTRGPKPKTDGSGKAKRMVPPEQLEEFKRAVDGSDMTKIALVEDLKKR